MHRKKGQSLKKTRSSLTRVQTDDKLNAFHTAVSQGDLPRVQEYLDANMPINQADVKGRTAMHFSCCSEMTRFLLDRQALVTVKDMNGNQPIHLAVLSNHLPIVLLLLERGADIHARDKNDKTPLDLLNSKLQQMTHRLQYIQTQTGIPPPLPQCIKDMKQMIHILLHWKPHDHQLSHLLVTLESKESCCTIQETVDVLQDLSDTFHRLQI